MNRRNVAYSTSSSDDESSDDDRPVALERYMQLDIKQGLDGWYTRRRAIQELTACLSTVYKSAVKTTQSAMLADTLQAVKCYDRRSGSRAALAELVRAAEKVLPQQKRSQVQGEYKRASLALTRSANKSGGRSSTGRDMDGVGGEDGEADGVEGPLFDLPLPSAVIETIMGQLDPVSLARAAWVCRAWRGMAMECRLWDNLAAALYPKAYGSRQRTQRDGQRESNESIVREPAANQAQHSAGAEHGSASRVCGSDSRQQSKTGGAAAFAALVAADPQPVLTFKACRAVVRGKPVWWDPGLAGPAIANSVGTPQGGVEGAATGSLPQQARTSATGKAGHPEQVQGAGRGLQQLQQLRQHGGLRQEHKQKRAARPVFPSVAEMVSWLQGKKVDIGGISSDSTDAGSSGSDSGTEAGIRKHDIRKQLRLWAI